MTNREKYILKRNEYDMMLAILNNTRKCPLWVLAGICTEEKIVRCAVALRQTNANKKEYNPIAACRYCVQKWLNEEAT